jgi:hypothetical protein
MEIIMMIEFTGKIPEGLKFKGEGVFFEEVEAPNYNCESFETDHDLRAAHKELLTNQIIHVEKIGTKKFGQIEWKTVNKYYRVSWRKFYKPANIKEDRSIYFKELEKRSEKNEYSES